jgi:Domain of unknown function (DUF4296)
MKKLLLFSFVLLLIMLSCNGRKHIPSGILKPDKMERVLYDIIVAEGYAESYLFKDSSKTKEEWMNQEVDKVLAIHKVSQETFMKSYDFYKSRPDLFKPVADSMYEKSQRNRERVFDKTIRETLE